MRRLDVSLVGDCFPNKDALSNVDDCSVDDCSVDDTNWGGVHTKDVASGCANLGTNGSSKDDTRDHSNRNTN